LKDESETRRINKVEALRGFYFFAEKTRITMEEYRTGNTLRRVRDREILLLKSVTGINHNVICIGLQILFFLPRKKNMRHNETILLKEIIMKSIRKSISNLQNYAQLANAARKGQKIQTVDTPEGRSYEIIINR
jgi:hypothetical protein